MTYRKSFAALAASAAIAVGTACPASSTPGPASSRSACAELGGTVGSDELCQINDATTTYDLRVQFPTDYPDEAAVAGYLAQRRTEFIEWADAHYRMARTTPFELDVVGTAYQSGDRQSGTRSLILQIGSDTGVHPVTTYKAFNYSLADDAPISFETLFKPGSNPLTVLNPVVRQQLLARDAGASAAADELTATSYRQFAITDDAIIFFFNQDGLLPHEDGPFQVTVPRSELASILA